METKDAGLKNAKIALTLGIISLMMAITVYTILIGLILSIIALIHVKAARVKGCETSGALVSSAKIISICSLVFNSILVFRIFIILIALASTRLN